MDLGQISRSNHIPAIGYIAPPAVPPLRKSGPFPYIPVAGRDLSADAPPGLNAFENVILRALPAETRCELAPFLKPVDLTKQTFLFHEGDRLDFVYFPVTAVVSEFRILDDGRMVEIAVAGRDGAIGLASFLLGSHFAPHITQVSQPGTAMRIDVKTFAVIVRSNEQLRSTLGRYVDLYIRQISQKAICNMYHTVKERLCAWLLTAQDRCRLNTLSLTHDQMSRILGVYRPSVSSIAHELRQNKIINYERGGISICDRKRVEALACACYLAPEWASADQEVLR